MRISSLPLLAVLIGSAATAHASVLVLPPTLHGQITLVDHACHVAATIEKARGESLSISVPADTYTMEVEDGTALLVATIAIDRADAVALDPADLHPATPAERNRTSTSWYRRVLASFDDGIRIERPATAQRFDALVTLGGTSREVHGTSPVGLAETSELSLGATLGDRVGFAYDASVAIGPGVFVGDHLQLGATIGVGLGGITGGLLGFAWKVPTEGFAVLELSPRYRTVAYFRQDFVYGAATRKRGSPMALWGDEAELGAGLCFTGSLDGFVYGSVREMQGVRYVGLGFGTVL